MRLPQGKLIGMALVVLFSAATIVRNPDWKNDEFFYASNAKVYPQNAYAWLGLGGVSLNKGNYAAGEHAFKMAEQHIADDRFIILPNSEYRLHLGLGTLAAHRNAPDEAKVHLRRALEIDPDGDDAYTILAAVLMNIDRNPEAAIPLLQKAMDLDPVNDQARDSMGVALYSLRRVDEAIPYFSQALQINPENELARQHLQTAMRRASQPR
jgi:tetratricopeptide (TPR) repeat protein